MLGSCRITALDAVREGIPLSGEAYFNKLKNKLNELESIGFTKVELHGTFPLPR